jgi:hypothetical protein
MPSKRQRQANNALGICFIASLFLVETIVAHQKNPSAASPFVWAVLGAVAVISLICYLRLKER